MNRIKFVSQNQNQTNFSNELSRRIRRYFKDRNLSVYGDYRMILKALLMLGLYLSTLIVVFTVQMPSWLALILMVVMGIGAAGIGMGVMHDAAHGTFSKHKWLNSLMANSMLLLGSSVINWKVQHNLLHHTYPNVYELDQDIETKALRLSSHSKEHSKLYRYQHFFGLFLYSFMTLSRLWGDFKQLGIYNEMGALPLYKTKYKSALRSLIVTKVLYLFVFFGLPFIFTDYSWWQILIGFLVLHTTASIIMATVFQLAHTVENLDQPLPDSNDIIQNEYFVHQLETTANFGRKHGLFSWYIGGLNFQIEHHLFPHICHIHYPQLAHIVKQTTKEYGQPYYCQKSAYLALRSHLRILKRLGRVEYARMG